jgi:Na+-driven multidrug efflux pump
MFVLCAGIGNFLAAFLLPTLIYYFHLGVTGAAISTVISQYVIFGSFLLLYLFILALLSK